MLTTRLWMGAVLVVLTVGMLVGDQWLAPVYPFLLLFQLGLSLFACYEFIELLGNHRAPQAATCFLGVAVLVLANWLQIWIGSHERIWLILAGILAGFLLLVFLYEMAGFAAPNRSVERMALTWFIIAYVGLLPCFFAQIRWLPDVRTGDWSGSIRLALAAFVPKCCDIGAYFTGKLIGRHPMTPILSPKKTVEGGIGGIVTAILATIGIDRIAGSVLGESLVWEIGFGLTVGIAGMIGDLAESLIKRDCQTKDASAVMPGFGGVLDVVDAIIYSAPVSYLWFVLLK